MLDMKAFLECIEFISERTMHDDFKDIMHVEYDPAIRRMAENMGFEAFSQSQSGISVKNYGAQNMRVNRSNYQKKSYDRQSDFCRICIRWNKDFGCSKTEEECGYSPICTKYQTEGKSGSLHIGYIEITLLIMCDTPL